MESKPNSGVIRRLAPSSCRYSPYAKGSRSGKKNMKAAVVRLGVKLSVCLAESMFLLRDDIRTMLWFCYKLCRDTHHYQKSESRDASRYQNSDSSRDANGYSPVVDRLFRVSYHVYSKYIKPKNGEVQDGGNPVQCELIRTTWKDFADGTVVLHRLVMLLRRKNGSFDDRLLLSAIAKYKQLLKNLENKLRSAKHVSGENGFASKAIESYIFSFWKSLFEEEAPKAMNRMILEDMFKPLFDQPKGSTFGFISPSELPALKVYSPYILGRGFVKQELKEEVVRLGAELSLYVAELMFLLSDHIGSMLRFCYQLWRDAKRNKKPNNPVVERLLRVIHNVYFKYIKPKNGVYQNGGRSVQWRLFRMARENFEGGIRDLEILVFVLRKGGGSSLYVGMFTTRIEETLKKVEEKLRCTKTVSEANGFAREAMQSNILDLWKSVFDKEAKEATQTMEVINNGMLSDLFLPLVTQHHHHHFNY